jgi:uncharacterized protein
MVERFFETWSRLVLAHPRRVLGVTLAALALCGLSISRLRFETDINSMIPSRSGAALEKIARTFGFREQSFLVVESPRKGDGAALLAFARAFEEALRGDDTIAGIRYGFEDLQSALLTGLLPYAPRYAPAGDEAIERLFSERDIAGRIARQSARLAFPGLDELPDLVERDPLDLAPLLLGRFAALKGTYRFDPASANFISPDGQAILIRIQGRRPADDMAAARATVTAIDSAARRAIERTGASDLTVHAGGAHFLARETEAVIRGDLTLSITLSMFIVLGLIAWVMRRVLAGVLVVPPIVIGLVGGLGAVSFAKSSIASLSMAGACIEVGLGVDFAIHLIQAALAEGAEGRDPRGRVARALAETGPSLFYASMTTVVAFLAFPASRFEFISEMGVITGFGVLISMIATVTVLPPILAAWLASRRGPRKMPRRLGVGAAVALSLRRPRVTLALTAAVALAAVASLVHAPPMLERDLRNIHSRDSRALHAERRLEELFGGSQEPLLFLIEADGELDLEDRMRRLEGPLDRLVARGVLAAHVSAAMLLPPVEVERLAIGRLSTLDPAALDRSITRELERAGFDVARLAPAVERIVAAARDLRPITISRLRELGLGELLQSFIRPDPDRPGGVLGLVTLFPSRALWSHEVLAATFREIDGALAEAGIHATLTGLAAVSAESAGLVVSDMTIIGGLTAIAVGILTVLQFRRMADIVLAFLPVTLGCLWTAALLNLLGYRLNLMNASVLPIVIGIGMDTATHVLHRHRLLRSEGDPPQGRELIRETFRVTGAAAALSSIAIMLSFGSLAFSSNRGLSSVGVLTFIGIGGSLLASITCLPAILEVARRRREGG